MKIRRITSEMVLAATRQNAEKPRVVVDEAPTLRPPPLPPAPTLPAPPISKPPTSKPVIAAKPARKPEPEADAFFVVKPTPIIVVPAELSPPPPPPPAAPAPLPPIATPLPTAPTPLDAQAVVLSVPSPAPRESPPRARRRRRWPLRVAVLIVLVGGEAYLAQRTGNLDLPRDFTAVRAMFGARTNANARVEDPANAPAPPPAPVLTDLQASPPVPLAIPPSFGLLHTRAAKPGHRIFVDERTVGQTPESVLVKCGAATVRIGSAGRAQAVTIPCGEEIAVDDR